MMVVAAILFFSVVMCAVEIGDEQVLREEEEDVRYQVPHYGLSVAPPRVVFERTDPFAPRTLPPMPFPPFAAFPSLGYRPPRDPFRFP
jgi:hypothetical protein